jgi:hypothetical protein
MNKSATHRIPLWLKVAYTVFLGVLVPSYWMAYGPTNFLYFCDVALFLALAALWLESPLLAGAAAVGILLPQMLWCLDFGAGLLGFKLIGLTEYMFDPNIALFYRGLSLFHGWLPFLLLFLVIRLGYDRRSLPAWTLVAWSLLVICYLWIPGPPGPTRITGQTSAPVNINYVHGFSDRAPQGWMHPHLWFALLIVALPALVYWPTHCLLSQIASGQQPQCTED